MQPYTKTINFNGEELTFTINKLAPRAESTVLAQIGETVVFTVVSVSQEDSHLDYFPLGIEYIEKFYAGGRISGSRFQKRERWPSDEAVLKARQIDHSIRSLFPKGFKKEVSVAVTVLAYDEVHDPETLAVTSASLALMNSSIPFNGPSASVMIGIKGDELILNPSKKHDPEDDFDGEFIVSVREGRVLNIEGYGDEIPESKMGELLDFAVEHTKPLLDVQIEIQKEIGKPKQEFAETPVPQEYIDFISDNYKQQITEALYADDRETREAAFVEIRNEAYDKFVEANSAEDQEESPKKSDVIAAIEYVTSKIMRAGILDSGKRTSGRRLDEVRELDIEIDFLPRVHGSALFSRGLTQNLAVLTLGSLRLAKMSENFEGEEEKTWMHHYNGPSYSFGQAGRYNFIPGRREVGHGNIGENALLKMLPSKDVFPYTIRVVSEIMSQNGSSSMAGATGASLALMAGGVPIKAPVAGISVGLVTAEDNLEDFKILVDLEDVEDFYGDMDFKVTGTRNGVTAIQLDNKLMGVPVEILKKGFELSKQARFFILDEMSKVISEPREQLSKFAPRVEILHIKPDKISEVIGPGGKMIKSIVEAAGGNVEIDIQDDGQVVITALDAEARNIAKQKIEMIIMEPELGKVYDATVASVKDYGIFVDVTSQITGLAHKSKLSDDFVEDPSKLFKPGDKVKAKLISMENGRMSFSLKPSDLEAK